MGHLYLDIRMGRYIYVYRKFIWHLVSITLQNQSANTILLRLHSFRRLEHRLHVLISGG